MEPKKIFIDSREPKNIKAAAELELQNRGFNPETKQLPQSDFYYPAEDVAIERKTVGDLISSIQKQRISNQADRMLSNYKHNYLIVEGENLFTYPHSNMSTKSITGQLISLAVKRNMKIIQTKNVDETGYAIARLFERYKDGEHTKQTEYLKTLDTGEVEDVEVAMLMQIEGISREKAEAITDEYYFRTGLSGFGSMISSHTDQVERDLQMIDGIGPKLSKRIINTFYNR